MDIAGRGCREEANVMPARLPACMASFLLREREGADQLARWLVRSLMEDHLNST